MARLERWCAGCVNIRWIDVRWRHTLRAQTHAEAAEPTQIEGAGGCTDEAIGKTREGCVPQRLTA
eukprot:2871381-Prymnesium_polylepis.2